jgi:cytochrome c peroxidase
MQFRIVRLKFTVVVLFAMGATTVFGASLLNRISVKSSERDVERILGLKIPKGIPSELWRKHIPSDNPMSREKVALGEALYLDKRLSSNGTVSCATCHDAAMAFADHNLVAIGAGGKVGTRNAPTLLNAMFNEHQFWDGRARSLEEQIKQPLTNAFEMGMPDHAAVIKRVAQIPEYQRAFRRVFKDEGLTIETIAKAIAAFERTLLSGNSPFDRYMTGDKNAITEAQQRGWELFKGKAKCIECHAFDHASPFFTDFKFHNTGVATKGKNFENLARRTPKIEATAPRPDILFNLAAHTAEVSELGRYLVTKQPKDRGAFKTPTLRDVELTAPYMHNGSEKTLFDVVRFYNRGGDANPHADEHMRPLNLTYEEMNELVEFMRALTSDDVLRRAQNATPQTRTPIQFSPALSK